MSRKTEQETNKRQTKDIRQAEEQTPKNKLTYYISRKQFQTKERRGKVKKKKKTKKKELNPN